MRISTNGRCRGVGIPIGDGEGLCETAASWRLLTGRLAPRFRHRSYSTTSEEPPLQISTATGTSPIDPVTGQVTNYELPLNYGNPYEIWPNLEDNLWVGNRAYGSLVRFDQQTEQFTYFPYPEPRARTPKLEVDDQGTLWFALNYAQPIVAFRPKGNVPMRRSSP